MMGYYWKFSRSVAKFRKKRKKLQLVTLSIVVFCLTAATIFSSTLKQEYFLESSRFPFTGKGYFYLQNLKNNSMGEEKDGAAIWAYDYELRTKSGLIGIRKLLGFPGSSPPRCISKCGRCRPCLPVHVPVPPGTPVTAEYYPEAWRCKCGNKLYMP